MVKKKEEKAHPYPNMSNLCHNREEKEGIAGSKVIHSVSEDKRLSSISDEMEMLIYNNHDSP